MQFQTSLLQTTVSSPFLTPSRGLLSLKFLIFAGLNYGGHYTHPAKGLIIRLRSGQVCPADLVLALEFLHACQAVQCNMAYTAPFANAQGDMQPGKFMVSKDATDASAEVNLIKPQDIKEYLKEYTQHLQNGIKSEHKNFDAALKKVHAIEANCLITVNASGDAFTFRDAGNEETIYKLLSDKKQFNIGYNETTKKYTGIPLVISALFNPKKEVTKDVATALIEQITKIQEGQDTDKGKQIANLLLKNQLLIPNSSIMYQTKELDQFCDKFILVSEIRNLAETAKKVESALAGTEKTLSSTTLEYIAEEIEADRMQVTPELKRDLNRVSNDASKQYFTLNEQDLKLLDDKQKSAQMMILCGGMISLCNSAMINNEAEHAQKLTAQRTQLADTMTAAGNKLPDFTAETLKQLAAKEQEKSHGEHVFNRITKGFNHFLTDLKLITEDKLTSESEYQALNIRPLKERHWKIIAAGGAGGTIHIDPNYTKLDLLEVEQFLNHVLGTNNWYQNAASFGSGVQEIAKLLTEHEKDSMRDIHKYPGTDKFYDEPELKTLGKNGLNGAVDPQFFRINPETGRLEVLSGQRPTGENALPGGMNESTVQDTVTAEPLEEVFGGSLFDGKSGNYVHAQQLLKNDHEAFNKKILSGIDELTLALKLAKYKDPKNPELGIEDMPDQTLKKQLDAINVIKDLLLNTSGTVKDKIDAVHKYLQNNFEKIGLKKEQSHHWYVQLKSCLYATLCEEMYAKYRSTILDNLHKLDPVLNIAEPRNTKYAAMYTEQMTGIMTPEMMRKLEKECGLAMQAGDDLVGPGFIDIVDFAKNPFCDHGKLNVTALAYLVENKHLNLTPAIQAQFKEMGIRLDEQHASVGQRLHANKDNYLKVREAAKAAEAIEKEQITKKEKQITEQVKKTEEAKSGAAAEKKAKEAAAATNKPETVVVAETKAPGLTRKKFETVMQQSVTKGADGGLTTRAVDTTYQTLKGDKVLAETSFAEDQGGATGTITDKIYCATDTTADDFRELGKKLTADKKDMDIPADHILTLTFNVKDRATPDQLEKIKAYIESALIAKAGDGHECRVLITNAQGDVKQEAMQLFYNSKRPQNNVAAPAHKASGAPAPALLLSRILKHKPESSVKTETTTDSTKTKAPAPADAATHVKKPSE